MPNDIYGPSFQNFPFVETKMIDDVNVKSIYSNTPSSETERLSLECVYR